MTRRQELIADLAFHPERHHHTFDGLYACCFYEDALDLDLMQKHEGLGLNGTRCDVVSGACSCGSNHPPESVVDQIATLEALGVLNEVPK